MANLILPSRFTQQPQYPVQLKSEFQSGWGESLYLGLGANRLTSQTVPLTTTEALTRIVTPLGVMLKVSDGNGYFGSPNNYPLGYFDNFVSRPHTLIFQHRPVQTNNNAAYIGLYQGLGSGMACELRKGGTNYEYRIKGSTTTSVATSTVAPNTAIARTLAFSTQGLTDSAPSMAIDGILQGLTVTAGVGSVTTGVDSLVIGVDETFTVNTSDIAFYLYLPFALPAGLLIEASRNPYGLLFQKRPQILYFDVGGGGATTYTYSGSGSVTFSGNAALDKVKSYPGSGSITYSGAATAAFVAGAQTYTYNGSGSINFAGSATTTTSKIYGFAGSGSLTFSGAATTTLVPVGSTTYSYNGSGSIAFSGTATTAEVKLYSAIGSGSITFDGTATTAYVPGLVTYSYTGSGNILFSGAAETTGPKVVELRPAGGGTSTVSGRKRQKLIIVERVEDVEELLEQVEEIVKSEPKARKTITKARKPLQTVQNQPETAFDWLSYYQAKLDTLRDQQRAESLKRQLDKNAEIIRVILAKQEEEARLALELQQEEEMLLLLMAA